MKSQTGPIPVRKILGPYWTKPGPDQSRLVPPRTDENTGWWWRAFGVEVEKVEVEKGCEKFRVVERRRSE